MSGQSRFIELKRVFRTLHGPQGCLWDKKQTHRSLIPHLKEEMREFICAVQKDHVGQLKEELGDILLHVMFNAQIAARQKRFDIEDVIAGLIQKLKRRHPHVFSAARVKSTRQIIANWKKIKAREKEMKRGVDTQKNKSKKRLH